MDIRQYIENLCSEVKDAAPSLASASTTEKNRILAETALLLRANSDSILEANRADLDKAAENGVPQTMLDRLRLTYKRIDGIADSLGELCSLPDPIGKGERIQRPNGLVITKIQVPLGVIAVIYEARPNVTVDAAALCIKSGNAVILRGGKEAVNTNRVLASIMREAVKKSGLDPSVIGFVDDTSREGTAELMKMRDYIDVLIPRGGKGLIKSVVENSNVPVIETGAGNCHLYVDDSADLDTAVKVAVNAKTSRPSVCNAIENLIVHESIADKFLPMFEEAVKPYNVEIRGDEHTIAILPNAVEADEEDYYTEYNDYIIAVKIVPDLTSAIKHINKHNTKHSEAIITQNYENAEVFKRDIDAAAVYVNASTRFTDGGEFGLGAEIGISTQKLHARGPVGLNELTSVKYLIDGNGQVR